jgi:hypothetical protein
MQVVKEDVDMAQKSTEEMREYMRAYRATKREESKASLGGKCVLCGTDVQLEFDHIDRTTKVDGIANLLTNSKETLDAELAKCQLLCHEHHREKSIAAGDLPEARHGSTGMYKQGCRCELCAGHIREYNRSYQEERREIRECYPFAPILIQPVY